MNGKFTLSFHQLQHLLQFACWTVYDKTDLLDKARNGKSKEIRKALPRHQT